MTITHPTPQEHAAHPHRRRNDPIPGDWSDLETTEAEIMATLFENFDQPLKNLKRIEQIEAAIKSLSARLAKVEQHLANCEYCKSI